MPDDHPDLAALSHWAPELARTFVALASDIALVVDDDGVIRNVAQGGTDPIAPGATHWVGRRWIDTVSGETRPKIEKLLQEVADNGLARRREVNHALGTEATLPVAYTAVRLGQGGPVLAVGRDLRTVAAIQQQFVESQQDMERGYWRARQAEARWQLLFQVATDAVLVLDGASLAIVEANQAAVRLLGTGAQPLQGRLLASAFEHHSRGAVNELLANARATAQSGEIRARLQGSQASVGVVATPFRSEGTMRLVVRLRAVEAASASGALNRNLARLVDDASDGVVVTDPSGRILIANPAFLALARLADESQLQGQPLMNWLALPDQPLAQLVAQVRREGIARQVEARVRRPAPAADVQVEIGAALLTEGDQECIGFTLHRATGAAGAELDPAAGGPLQALGAAVAALAARLGTSDLATLRDAGAVLVERYLVDEALQRAAGDPAAAGALLGLAAEQVQQLGRQPPAAAAGQPHGHAADDS